jgi:hypothetical protein
MQFGHSLHFTSIPVTQLMAVAKPVEICRLILIYDTAYYIGGHLLVYYVIVYLYSLPQLCCANEDALTVYKRPYPRPCHSSGYGIQKATLAVAGHVLFHRESL